MLRMEEVMRELAGGDHEGDVNEQGLPPGFRFHPTDEELITFYLASKVFNGTFCGVQIAEVDLNRCEPWELPDVAKMGEREWYFFSLRDRKYPTGLRTNRATGAGYWKATGKDREVYSASTGALLGMKKTLVFYKGRAPRGQKTKWVMHEYRLDGDFSYRHASKEEWVICRIFHKSLEKKNSIVVHEQECGTQLPPLLDSPTSAALLGYQMQNPFVIGHPENDLRSQINEVMSHSNLFPINNNSFQPPSISLINSNYSAEQYHHHPSLLSGSSMLIKPLLSNQECTTSIPKQCKTGANFYHVEMLNANTSFHLGDKNKIHHHPSRTCQNPLFLEIDANNNNYSSTAITSNSSSSSSSLMGSSAAAVVSGQEATHPHQMSTSNSFSFSKNSLQMMIDQPMKIIGDSSWPLGV